MNIIKTTSSSTLSSQGSCNVSRNSPMKSSSPTSLGEEFANLHCSSQEEDSSLSLSSSTTTTSTTTSTSVLPGKINDGEQKRQVLGAPPHGSFASPLDALALACAAETEQQVTTGSSSDITTEEQKHQQQEQGYVTIQPAVPATIPPLPPPPPPAASIVSTSNGNSYENHSTQEGAVTTTVSPNDVLCGRGGLSNHHPGNVFFRKLVRIKQESYLLASKREKASVAREIVDVIRGLNPPGRFLKKKNGKSPSKKNTKSKEVGSDGSTIATGIDNNDDVWVEIGNRKAREKTSQALREGAPELREDLHQQQQHKVELTTAPQVFNPHKIKNKNDSQGGNPPVPTTPSTTVSSAPDFFHPLYYHQVPSSTTTCLSSNRARVVSSDSVSVATDDHHGSDDNTASSSGSFVLLKNCTSHLITKQTKQDRPHFKQDRPHFIIDTASTYAGSTSPGGANKRKVDDISNTEEKPAPTAAKLTKGPRLKLLKSRLKFHCV